MFAAENPVDRKAHSALRFGCIALVVLAIAGGSFLRFRHLGAHFSHFDEAFPVALITRARATGNLDMNVRDADVPAIAKYNQYAGSSYHYSVLAWDTVMRVFRGWPEDNHNRPSLLRLRAFSALLGSAALVLIAFLAWRMSGPIGAAFATVLAALNPTLVQDSHYARPDAFLVFLTLGYFMLVGRTSPPRLGRVVLGGIVLGVLVAAKNTMGLLAAVPCLWLVDATDRRGTLRLIGVCALASIFAFGATEPGAWMHFSDFMDGVRRLETQYSHAFPVSGPPDGGASYGMAVAYFTATLGVVTCGLAVIGAGLALKRRAWTTVVLWALPIVVFGAYFGSKTIFFERAYSPFLPGIFLLGGIAVADFASRVRSQLALLVLATVLAALPGALISVRFVGDVLSGDSERRVARYDHELAEVYPQVPMVITPMWYAGHLDPLVARWRADHKPFILRVADYDDRWTASEYTALLTQLPAHEFVTLDGPFAGFPVSTLQVYHVPTWHYVWVGGPPTAVAPKVPPADDGVVLRAIAALSTSRVGYAMIAWVAGAATLLLALIAAFRDESGSGAGQNRSWLDRPWLFPASVVLTLYAFRWPAFFHHPELNVDEAHTLAGAITLCFDPVYWRSVDGTTHGPLNDAVLIWPRLFGWPIDFLTARVLGCALVAGSLLWVWAGVRAIWGEAVARLSVLPILAFFALSTFWDFVHYSSEHLSVFLLATGWGALVLGNRSPGRRTAWWAVAGLALGAVPWAKMQGGPVAAVLAVYAFGTAWQKARSGAEHWRRPALTFGAMLVLPALLVAVHLTAFQLWPDFWQSYIINNVRYATQTKMYSLAGMARKLPEWIGDAEGLAPLVIGLGVFVVTSFVWFWKADRRDWRYLAFAAILALSGFYSAAAAGRVFYHYLLFAVIPVGGIAIPLLAAGWRSKGARRLAVIGLFVGATLVPQIIAKARRPNPFLDDAGTYANRIGRVAQIVRHYARAGEPLGIWGFMPRFYVETGLPQASREGHNERQLLPHPQLAYYRARYLNDLRVHNPPVYLDAVGPGPQIFWPKNRATFGHETWTGLRDWVGHNYVEVDDIDGVRIYVRKDRLPARP